MTTTINNAVNNAIHLQRTTSSTIWHNKPS